LETTDKEDIEDVVGFDGDERLLDGDEGEQGDDDPDVAAANEVELSRLTEFEMFEDVPKEQAWG
jgi:hypothetical protein